MWPVFKKMATSSACVIGGSRGGGRPARAPPYGSRFFRFDMQNFWNIAASGVHGPPYEVHAPPYGKSWIRHCVWLIIEPSYLIQRCICFRPEHTKRTRGYYDLHFQIYGHFHFVISRGGSAQIQSLKYTFVLAQHWTCTGFVLKKMWN